MNFWSVLVFVYLAGIGLGLGAFLTLVLQLAIRTQVQSNRSIARFNARMISYLMLLGLFVLSFAAGGIVCHQFLRTSQFPEPVLLAIRFASLAAIIAPSVFLHVRFMPILKHSDGPRIVDAVPAATILGSSLAGSLAFLGWAFLILSSIHSNTLMMWNVAHIFPLLAVAIPILWILLFAILLGERGQADLKAIMQRIKKRLTPPTPLEVQRVMRTRRMNTMTLPSTPRRRA
jgi:hypothetical protein